MEEEIEESFEVRIVRNATNGIVKAEHWSKNGKSEGPPGDRPASTHYDEHGNIESLYWRKSGALHREGKPAIIEINTVNNVHVEEVYFSHGKCHREDRQPAIIERDPQTGEIPPIELSM
jgi:hypothetical protein